LLTPRPISSAEYIQRSIKTGYPTKDWVISDFVVTDPKFGAKAKPGFDNRPAFQAAIDAAYKYGGGVVYIPAGNYEFRSTQTGNQER
jgi:polygalacturonase